MLGWSFGVAGRRPLEFLGGGGVIRDLVLVSVLWGGRVFRVRWWGVSELLPFFEVVLYLRR